jgi:hypothetical protein
VKGRAAFVARFAGDQREQFEAELDALLLVERVHVLKRCLLEMNRIESELGASKVRLAELLTGVEHPSS